MHSPLSLALAALRNIIIKARAVSIRRDDMRLMGKRSLKVMINASFDRTQESLNCFWSSSRVSLCNFRDSPTQLAFTPLHNNFLVIHRALTKKTFPSSSRRRKIPRSFAFFCFSVKLRSKDWVKLFRSYSLITDGKNVPKSRKRDKQTNKTALLCGFHFRFLLLSGFMGLFGLIFLFVWIFWKPKQK